jgi:hypothetical protein
VLFRLLLIVTRLGVDAVQRQAAPLCRRCLLLLLLLLLAPLGCRASKADAG